ncbi:NADPH-dependent FMN reductase [Chelativorans sp. Marseille-P2723]|uniref:NADPH-dependent FMN reductase n=1 Tax=Chelativorans sp. Marseille-P2723 TaxID=2709133 RepID=UPI00156E2F98|nr:NADPH-dependent FMN reductase [Chelativorans sp. Marseille-P2723]
MSLKLNIIIGSTRPGRKGPFIANWLAQVAGAHGAFNVDLVDLMDFNLPLLDEAAHPRLQQYEHEHTRRWAESVDSADAFVFVTPEYDYFPPASVVNAVQVLQREWHYKPAGLMSYGGVSGGMRSAQSLRLLLGNVNVHALPQEVPVPFFPKFLGENGEFVPDEQIVGGAKAMLTELHKWAVALKPIRKAERKAQVEAA